MADMFPATRRCNHGHDAKSCISVAQLLDGRLDLPHLISRSLLLVAEFGTPSTNQIKLIKPTNQINPTKSINLINLVNLGCISASHLVRRPWAHPLLRRPFLLRCAWGRCWVNPASVLGPWWWYPSSQENWWVMLHHGQPLVSDNGSIACWSRVFEVWIQPFA